MNHQSIQLETEPKLSSYSPEVMTKKVAQGSASSSSKWATKAGDEAHPKSVHVSVACSLVAVLAASPTAFPSSWPIGVVPLSQSLESQSSTMD